MASKTIQTTCPMDCPDTCALDVEVDGDRVVAIRGRKDHPDTAGFICSKVAKFAQRQEHVDRVLYPARRVGPKGAGRFERVGWDEALDEVATRFRAIAERWGGEAILPFHYGGSNGKLTDEFLDTLFFERLGASRLAKTICATPTKVVAEGMYGRMTGVAFEDFMEARLIVIWGANPRASNIHLVPYLRQARRHGARIVTVDPRRTLGERDTEMHLPVRPGADLPLALGVIERLRDSGGFDQEFLRQHCDGLEPLLEAASHWSVERAASASGVEADSIRRFADLYAESSPAVIRCGWGLERNRNGGRAVAVIIALPALAGKFGVRGGGYAMSNSGTYKVDVPSILGIESRSPRRLINMNQLGKALAGGAEYSPPVQGLFVYNANPAATVPNQQLVLSGLAREDLFTVVHEQVMTDTARYADIVLPATTFLEHHDLRAGYGSLVIGGVAPAVAPAGEAKSNAEVFAALAGVMGFDDEPFGWSAETAVRRLAAAIERPGPPLDAEQMLDGKMAGYDFPGASPVQFGNVFPRTPNGRIQLTPEVLGNDPFHFEPPADDFPLALISPATSRTISSSMGEYNLDRLDLTMHPDDAAPRRLADGAPIRVYNGLGEVHCWLRLDDSVRPGTVAMPKGAWRKASANGATATALCPDHLGTAGGACFNDARVEVETRGAGRGASNEGE